MKAKLGLADPHQKKVEESTLAALQVPYKELGVFLNISDTSQWMKEAPPQWRLHPIKRPDDGTDAQWWVPDIDISDVTIQVSC